MAITLYVPNIIGNGTSGTNRVSTFDAASLGPVNLNFLTLPATIVGVLLSGGVLYVASTMPGSDVVTIGTYDPTTGNQTNPSLITVQGTYKIMHLNGSTLFVQVAIARGNQLINAYNSSTGAFLGAVQNSVLGWASGFSVG